MAELDGPTNGGEGSLAAAISNLVVRTTAEYTGRGPTRARTTLDENFVACVLEDALTKGERRLREIGMGDEVVQGRRHYQTAMRHDLVAGVERLTGRTVKAFLSDSSVDPDVSIEAFLFHPRQGDRHG